MAISSLDRIEGLPPGVANGVVGQGEVIGEALAADPRVDKISFTGSSEVGRRLMEPRRLQLQARRDRRRRQGAGHRLPGCEPREGDGRRGGRDLPVRGPVVHCGIAAAAPRSIHDATLDGLIAGRALRVGSPLDEDTARPMVSERQLERVLGYVERGRSEQARLILGGERLGGEWSNGFYMAPTIFDDVHADMSIASAGIFGRSCRC